MSPKEIVLIISLLALGVSWFLAFKYDGRWELVSTQLTSAVAVFFITLAIYCFL